MPFVNIILLPRLLLFKDDCDMKVLPHMTHGTHERHGNTGKGFLSHLAGSSKNNKRTGEE
jgi:hypothetical protein